MGFNDVERRLAGVARVGTQVLVAPLRRIDPLDHDGLKHRLELRHIMAMGSGHDERQRDATTVDQQMALAAIFFPDLLDWGQRLTVPEALSSSPRRCFASARRCLQHETTNPDIWREASAG